MGCISSPSRKIDNMQFNPIPNYKTITGKMVKYGKTVVILGAKGSIYTNIDPLNRHVHCSGIRSWSIELFESLKMLGLISSDDEKIHSEYLKRLGEQEKIEKWINDIRYHNEYEDVNPALKVDMKVWKELWNQLDYFSQNRNIKCKPPHARVKPRPQI